MERIRTMLRMRRREQVGETAAFAVVASLIVVTAAAVLGTMGGRILARCMESVVGTM